jgi:hypothetical protein
MSFKQGVERIVARIGGRSASIPCLKAAPFLSFSTACWEGHIGGSRL